MYVTSQPSSSASDLPLMALHAESEAAKAAADEGVPTRAAAAAPPSHVYYKKTNQRKAANDGGVSQQRDRESAQWLVWQVAQWYLEAKERYPLGSAHWARATADAFDMLRQEECDEMTKPGWWNDKELKALSAKVVRSAPADIAANQMRACVLNGRCNAWKAGPRSKVELRWAATHLDRAAAGLRLLSLLQGCSAAAQSVVTNADSTALEELVATNSP